MTPAAELDSLERLAVEQARSAPSLQDALSDVAAMRYDFRPSDLRHVSWDEARRRGYAACGEAAAYLAAAALRDGRDVQLSIVTGDPAECGPGYRHAVAVVDGVPLDVYAGRACPSPPVPLAVAALEAQMGCGCGNRSAGSANAYLGAVQAVCGVPGMADAMTAGRTLLKLIPLREASELSVDLIEQLGLNVDRKPMRAVWDALEGLLAMCDPRAAGWEGDTLRVTAGAVDVVAAAGPALHVASAAIAGAGFLVEVVGEAVTIPLAAAISTVVAVCQVLHGTGVTDDMRAAGADLDKKTSTTTTPKKPAAPRIPGINVGGRGGLQPVTRGAPSQEAVRMARTACLALGYPADNRKNKCGRNLSSCVSAKSKNTLTLGSGKVQPAYARYDACELDKPQPEAATSDDWIAWLGIFLTVGGTALSFLKR